MGRDQIEIVRETYAAFNRGDLDTVLALTDPDVEICDPDRTGRVFHGHDGYRGFLLEWLESWDEYTVEPEELRQNDERVLARVMQSGRGKGSGIEFSEPLNNVFTIRDGKIIRFEIYIDRAEAERAAGIGGE